MYAMAQYVNKDSQTLKKGSGIKNYSWKEQYFKSISTLFNFLSTFINLY